MQISLSGLFYFHYFLQKMEAEFQHHKLLSIFHPLSISPLEKRQMAVRKQREPLVRDRIGINSSCISLLVFCLFFCLSLEKKISQISQPPGYTHANDNHYVHLLGVGIHPLRTTLRSPSNMSRQCQVGCHMPFLCSAASFSPSACLPGAAHGAETTASQPHGKMLWFFSWLFLTQISSLISFSMWPQEWLGEKQLCQNKRCEMGTSGWRSECWMVIIQRRTAPGAVLPPRHAHGYKCLWVPGVTACKPGAKAISRWRVVQKDGLSLSI